MEARSRSSGDVGEERSARRVRWRGVAAIPLGYPAYALLALGLPLYALLVSTGIYRKIGPWPAGLKVGILCGLVTVALIGVLIGLLLFVF